MGKRNKGPSPEGHLPLMVGACVAAAASTLARLPGAAGACGCPREPTLAPAAVSAHRCLGLPVHARVYVWAAAATWAPLHHPSRPAPRVWDQGIHAGSLGKGGAVSPPTLAVGKGEGEREV